MMTTNSTHQWQQFFDHHAAVYLQNGFTNNTLAEVDFLIEVLQLAPGSAVLDIGCGVGRHTLELARRGYRMTGLDISNGMLAEGQKVAQAEGLAVEWIQADASRFTPERQFDGVYTMCEGAFSLLSSTDDPIDHDLAILRNMHAALKPGRRVLVCCLNGMRYLRHYTPQDVASGKFDPLTMAECYDMEYDTPGGKRSVPVRERGYVPTELRLTLRVAGFEVDSVWGGTAGMPFYRSPEMDEIELMALAHKAA